MRMRRTSPGGAPRRASPLSVAVVVVLLALTTALTLITSSIHDSNEQRLLKVELEQAGSVVSAALPSLEIPLTSAWELAEATDGSREIFMQYMRPLVASGAEFTYAALWHVGPSGAKALVSVGSSPASTGSPSSIAAFATRSRGAASLAVMGMLRSSRPGIVYAAAPVATSDWVVVAATALPRHGRLQVTRNSAFSQLDYAIYLGKSRSPANLLAVSPGPVPHGPGSAMVNTPFGDTSITIVAAPNTELGGTLLADLPWIIAAAGAALAVVAGAMTEVLVRRRRHAESLAAENDRLYREQRSIAEVLQSALLPKGLPEVPGVEASARYVAGRRGTDVGGDWYDMVPLGRDQFLLVVGDVSGHGVEAATIMARLHFAIRAYALQGSEPDEILKALGSMLSIDADRSFATIVCGKVDVAARTITVVNAGHPPMLVVRDGQGSFLETATFPPVGVSRQTEYRSTSFDIAPGATIMAFTDGLVERRGEVIDEGLERLRSAGSAALGLDDLLDKLVSDLGADGYRDDMAILAVRWTS